jgi:hypothetical protein
MGIAAREREGEGWQEEIAADLAAFYAEAAPHPDPLPARGERVGQRLFRSFATDLRNGAFETSPSRASTARAILWRLTMGKLREGNPHFLTANGVKTG